MYLLMAGLSKYQRSKLRGHQGFYSSPLSYKYSSLLKPLSSSNFGKGSPRSLETKHFSTFDYSRLRGVVQKTLQILCGAAKQFRGIQSQGPGHRGPKPLIAVCQVTSTPDREHNWEACSQLVREATRRDACIVFLPEAFDFIGSCTEETLSLAEPLEGDYLQRYVSLARECGVWLSLGGFHERGKDWESTRRIYNCHLLVDATETQSYVVAAAQTGQHHPRRTSFGHSMVVDPWGSIVAQCQEGPGLCFAEIDLPYLHRLRQEMPVFAHRQPRFYSRAAAEWGFGPP
ncbi:hypothetical protein E2320_013731 [Naja naja]|nr:hypothetical protein E2320_013731 [Naja naja]